MAGDVLILVSAGSAILGIAILRYSWRRTGRSVPLNIAGWLLLAIGAVGGWSGAGAWGLTVIMLVGTAAACIALIPGAFEMPKASRRARAAANGASGAEAGDWRRGLMTFALTGPAALVVTIAIALAARDLAMRWPVAEADGNVMVLGLVPLVWPLLTFAMLMCTKRTSQIAMLAIPLTLSLVPLILLGGRS